MQITQLEKTQQGLYHEIYLLNKEIAGKKKEVSERDQTIGDKEKRIYDLKKKNQELEKFKFVLDYKIKELKKQLEPRDAEIQAKQEQIQEMRMEEERSPPPTLGLRLALRLAHTALHGSQAPAAICAAPPNSADDFRWSHPVSQDYRRAPTGDQRHEAEAPWARAGDEPAGAALGERRAAHEEVRPQTPRARTLWCACPQARTVGCTRHRRAGIGMMCTT